MDFEQYLETSKAKALQQKLQVQPGKSAGSKIRKCQCCKTVKFTLFWCLISEGTIRSLATAKINSHKSEYVGRARMSKVKRERYKPNRLLLKKEDFKSS
jgi:hypothetical protein